MFKLMMFGINFLSMLETLQHFVLIYLINDEAEGYYVLYNFESAPEFPAELERIARITDGILRSLVVKK